LFVKLIVASIPGQRPPNYNILKFQKANEKLLLKLSTIIISNLEINVQTKTSVFVSTCYHYNTPHTIKENILRNINFD